MRLPTAGEHFERKYLIKEELGEGGFATVFRASDLEVQRDVAIKVLAPQGGVYPPGVVARFMVEARVIAGLKDPHTIRLFEFGESTDGLLYMVFQYVAGDDLAKVLHHRGALPPETAVHIATQVLHALAEAHEFDVLHRDIKPANILIHGYMGDQFAAKLLDFGIAKADATGGGAGLTKTGTRLGTPRYMSPEQVFGEPVGPRSDLYSLGLVLFEMLVGRPAVEGDQKQILQHQLSDATLVVPAHIAWPALRAVVDRMISRELIRRFGTAREVVVALQSAMARREDELPRTTEILPEARPDSSNATPRREPNAVPKPTDRRWLVGSLVLCVTVGAAAIALSRDTRPDRPTSTEIPRGLLKSTPPVSPGLRVVVDVGVDPPDLNVPDVDSVEIGAPADGCGVVHDLKEELWLDLVYRDRTARAYLPADYDPKHRYPIVLAFGPKYLSLGDFARDAGLNKLARKKPVIVLVPKPDNRVNPWDQGLEELEAARRTIRGANERFCVDRSRVYAYGHHDGGRLVREAACSLRFSGIVLTGFAEKHTDRDTCEIEPSVPTMWVLGNDDPFIPRGGGNGCTSNSHLADSAHDSVWKERNECGGESQVWRRTRESECNTWDCAVPYVSCRADGGHHLAESDWTILYPRCANTVLQFDVGNAAWQFFVDHGRVLTPEEQRHNEPR